MIVVIIISFFLTSCGPGKALGPTITPSPTSTNTPQLTSTITPTPEPTATITLIPTATFHGGGVSNPALNVTDVRVTVKGDLVTAIFYLQDVPEKMAFYRTGVPINNPEYKWEVYIDTDNDLNTGFNFEGHQRSGTDYSLTAWNIIGPQEQKGSFPIEEVVHADVNLLSGNISYSVSQGNIEVDPEANTITLTGTIPGVTTNSQFFYSTTDFNPDGENEGSYGQIFDRITFIK
ncbi:MAG: hypothetical protein NTZ74_05710 [Chloroflexi bacterium]|nr:hypothetical protein [Chloroflexota bacterium]